MEGAVLIKSNIHSRDRKIEEEQNLEGLIGKEVSIGQGSKR